MAKVKPFVGHTVMVGREWGEIVGSGLHRQIDVLVLALTKADVIGLVEDRTPGNGTWLAKQVTAVGGRSNAHLGDIWEAVLAAPHVDSEQPGVYITSNTGNRTVFRVETDGTYTSLGTVRRVSVLVPEES